MNFTKLVIEGVIVDLKTLYRKLFNPTTPVVLWAAYAGFILEQGLRLLVQGQLGWGIADIVFGVLACFFCRSALRDRDRARDLKREQEQAKLDAQLQADFERALTTADQGCTDEACGCHALDTEVKPEQKVC